MWGEGLGRGVWPSARYLPQWWGPGWSGRYRGAAGPGVARPAAARPGAGRTGTAGGSVSRRGEDRYGGGLGVAARGGPVRRGRHGPGRSSWAQPAAVQLGTARGSVPAFASPASPVRSGPASNGWADRSRRRALWCPAPWGDRVGRSSPSRRRASLSASGSGPRADPSLGPASVTHGRPPASQGLAESFRVSAGVGGRPRTLAEGSRTGRSPWTVPGLAKASPDGPLRGRYRASPRLPRTDLSVVGTGPRQGFPGRAGLRGRYRASPRGQGKQSARPPRAAPRPAVPPPAVPPPTALPSAASPPTVLAPAASPPTVLPPAAPPSAVPPPPASPSAASPSAASPPAVHLLHEWRARGGAGGGQSGRMVDLLPRQRSRRSRDGQFRVGRRLRGVRWRCNR
jgi:hypothetical protein